MNIIKNQTDLKIGLNILNCGYGSLRADILSILDFYYDRIREITAIQPEFRYSLKPINMRKEFREIDPLYLFSKKAGVGPMAGIAGFFDEIISDYLKNISGDYFIENGGDIKLVCNSEKKIKIYSPSKDFEDNIHVILPEGEYGIASSSGTKGHSLSFGNSDLVTVICKNAIEADCFATTIGNRIKNPSDADNAIEEFDFLDGVFIFLGEKMWYKGKYKISL